MKKNISFFRRPIGIFFIILVFGGGIGLVFWKLGFQSVPPELITVRRGIISQDVRVTGQLRPMQAVELGFETSGKVFQVLADVGENVVSGKPLVVLTSDELAVQLERAQAEQAAEIAKLYELERGPRPEEVQVSYSKLQSASSSLQEARKQLITSINDVYIKIDNAVRNKVDSFFLNSRSAPQVAFYVYDSQVEIDLESGRANLEFRLSLWKNALSSLTIASDLNSYVATASENIVATQVFLENATLALNNLSPTGSLTQTTIDTWRANLSGARTEVSGAVSDFASSRESLQNAEVALKVAHDEYELAKAGATSGQIDSQKALVDQSVASVKLIQTQLDKTILRSPISGVVTRQDARVGEIVATNQSLVSVITADALEIEANVPEVDIGHIALGNSVRFTVDALPGEDFLGSVSHVDPAETVIDGVANFKIKIELQKSDARFKSGLTTNVVIQTLTKSGVLILPQYAIIENDTGTFVHRMTLGIETEIPVAVGIRNQEGIVEILSGVNEGDRVVNIGFKNGRKQ